ncbi:MAG: hypothetical protein WAN43_05470 [Rhodomicrobium sp.]
MPSGQAELAFSGIDPYVRRAGFCVDRRRDGDDAAQAHDFNKRIFSRLVGPINIEGGLRPIGVAAKEREPLRATPSHDAMRESCNNRREDFDIVSVNVDGDETAETAGQRNVGVRNGRPLLQLVFGRLSLA